jgi:hypothetical protein
MDIIAPQAPLQYQSRSELSWLTDTLSNAPPAEMQQQHRHQLVHHDNDIAATVHMTKNTIIKILCETKSSQKKKHNASGYDKIQFKVDDH